MTFKSTLYDQSRMLSQCSCLAMLFASTSDAFATFRPSIGILLATPISLLLTHNLFCTK